MQPSLDIVDSVDSGHGTSAASSAGTATAAAATSIPAAAPGAAQTQLSAGNEIGLANNASYVKIPPVDNFLASLTAASVSPGGGAAASAADCCSSGAESLSSPTFATFHPAGKRNGNDGKDRLPSGD